MSRHPSSWPAAATLPVVWVAYALAMLFLLPFSPLTVMAMLVPLLVTGWYAKDWFLPATVGLAHGLVLAGLVIRLGVFPLETTDPASYLAGGLLVLLSWFTAIAGRTIRLVTIVRQQSQTIQRAEHEIDQSAAAVEAVWDTATMALISIDAKGDVLAWNPGAEQIFGRTASSMEGTSITRLAADGDPEDCMGPIQYALDMQRDTPPFEGKLRHGNGQLMQVEVRTRPVVHPEGGPGLILSIVDRTKEHVMEDALQEQAERQTRLLQNLEEVLYSVEVPGRHVTMMTKTVEKLTGAAVRDFADFKDFMALAHPDDEKAVRERWEHARSGEKSTLRWRMRTADGSHMWVEDRVVPVRNDEGRVIRLDGIVRRIYGEVELERQAQRMMRWLDALEPMTGCGAWALDLRSGEWQWSSGIHEILGIRPEEQEDLSTWMARLGTTDAARLEALVDAPETARPFRVQIYHGDEPQECLIEPWIQRGDDGEPIWLYGLLRPRQAEATKERGRPRGGLQVAVGGSSTSTSGGTVTVQRHPPGSPEAINRFLRAALARSRRAVEAAAGLDAEVKAAVHDHVQATVTSLMDWTNERRVPVATGQAAVYEPIQLEVARSADEAVRRCVDRILAQEQAKAERIAEEAGARAQDIQEKIEAQVAEARSRAEQAVKEATRKAQDETARAVAAEEKRQRLEAAMEQALQNARERREAAVDQAEQARAAALQQADEARQQAEQEASTAEAAKAALAEAQEAREEALQDAHAAVRKAEAEAKQARELARHEAETAEKARAALAKAEQARDQALEEAGKARREAMREAEEARKRAEKEAEEARKATAALAEAEEARQQAAKEAEVAKQKAESEAGEARAEAMKLAEEAQERARRLAAEAQSASQARDAAQQASQQALASAQQAQQQAMQEAEQANRRAERLAQEAKEAAEARDAADEARREALEAADRVREEIEAEIEAANERAEVMEREAKAAAKARVKAESALQQAQAAAKKIRDDAMQEAEDAKTRAEAEAEEAIGRAHAEAEAARQEAEAEAEKARVADKARRAAEEKAEAAMAAAQGDAEQALHEAQELREAARKEAEKARAAAKAEATKAEQAEKARDRAIQKAEKARDRAIQEAQAERAEAVAAAEAARDRAVRSAESAREEAEERAAALEAELAIARGETVGPEEAESEAAESEEAEEVEAEEATKEEPEEAGQPAMSPWAAAEAEEEGVEMDVVWDDEIGWIPKPRGEPHKDKAEQLKAKKTSGPRRTKGPWALDD